MNEFNKFTDRHKKKERQQKTGETRTHTNWNKKELIYTHTHARNTYQIKFIWFNDSSTIVGIVILTLLLNYSKL